MAPTSLAEEVLDRIDAIQESIRNVLEGPVIPAAQFWTDLVVNLEHMRSAALRRSNRSEYERSRRSEPPTASVMPQGGSLD